MAVHIGLAWFSVAAQSVHVRLLLVLVGLTVEVLSVLAECGRRLLTQRLIQILNGLLRQVQQSILLLLLGLLLLLRRWLAGRLLLGRLLLGDGLLN